MHEVYKVKSKDTTNQAGRAHTADDVQMPKTIINPNPKVFLGFFLKEVM